MQNVADIFGRVLVNVVLMALITDADITMCCQLVTECCD